MVNFILNIDKFKKYIPHGFSDGGDGGGGRVDVEGELEQSSALKIISKKSNFGILCLSKQMPVLLTNIP